MKTQIPGLLPALALAACALVLLGSLPVCAQIPMVLEHDGFLEERGRPANGNRNMQVRVYNAAKGGSVLYSENVGRVRVTNGEFYFNYGGAGAGIAAALKGSQHWLAVVVNNVEQSPRLRLVPVPFALRAKESEDAQVLKGQVGTLSTSVSAVQGQATTLSSNLTSLNSRHASLSSNITALQTQNTALTSNVTTLQNQNATLISSIGNLQSESTAASSNLTVLMGLLTTSGLMNPDFKPEMITVEAGTLPGSSELAGTSVQEFQIAKYEVTYAEWVEVQTWASDNGYDLGFVGGGSSHHNPVSSVSWYDVVKWCNAKSEKEGLAPVYRAGGAVYRSGQKEPSSQNGANGYRLPTEAEWEWAARGGVSSKGYAYSGSSDPNAVAWWVSNSGGGTKAVGTKAANELGIHDMSGNLFEWCEDTVSSGYVRGGSWGYGTSDAAVAARDKSYAPDERSRSVGFRLARNAN